MVNGKWQIKGLAAGIYNVRKLASPKLATCNFPFSILKKEV